VAGTPQPKAKRKHGPKSKNAATEIVPPEADIPEANILEASIPEASIPEASISEARDNVAQMSEALDTPYAPVMWTSEVQVAPVARMY